MAGHRNTDRFEVETRAAFRRMAAHMAKLQRSQQTMSELTVSLARTSGGEAAKKGGVLRKFLDIVNTIAALLIAVCLLVVLMWAVPEARKQLERLANNADKPSALAGVLIGTLAQGKSVSTDDRRDPVLLTHAIMLRVPYRDVNTADVQTAYNSVHEVLADAGGWNRRRIERRSDRDDDVDRGQIAQKYMYFVALAEDQIQSITSQLAPVLKQHFPHDHMLITVSLADQSLINNIPAAPPAIAAVPVESTSDGE